LCTVLSGLDRISVGIFTRPGKSTQGTTCQTSGITAKGDLACICKFIPKTRSQGDCSTRKKAKSGLIIR